MQKLTKSKWKWIGRSSVLLAVLIAGVLGLDLYLLDGLDGWFFSHTFEEDTIFAPGYSDESFRRVRLQMSMDEVRSLLGPPLAVGEVGDRTSWAYAKSPGDKSRRIRTIVFRDDFVAKVIHRFYVD